MSNLEQLQNLTRMIEESTEGRQRLMPNLSGGGVDIQADNDAYTGLLLRTKADYDTGNITLSFHASVRRMGRWMSPREFQFVADEIQEMINLLYELEQTTITVNPEEMERWSGWLAARQIDRAIEQAHEREPQLDATMGMP